MVAQPVLNVLVCVGPGQKSQRPALSLRGSFRIEEVGDCTSHLEKTKSLISTFDFPICREHVSHGAAYLICTNSVLWVIKSLFNLYMEMLFCYRNEPMFVNFIYV